jgi:uncharacterized protein YyaL (SSP411 family)
MEQYPQYKLLKQKYKNDSVTLVIDSDADIKTVCEIVQNMEDTIYAPQYTETGISRVRYTERNKRIMNSLPSGSQTLFLDRNGDIIGGSLRASKIMDDEEEGGKCTCKPGDFSCPIALRLLKRVLDTGAEHAAALDAYNDHIEGVYERYEVEIDGGD